MRPLPKRFSLNPIQRFLLSRLASAVRHVYRFDGVDDRGQLAFRAINIEGDNTFEFWTPTQVSASDQQIIAQNVMSGGASSEFRITYINNGTSVHSLGITYGGTQTTVATNAHGLKAGTKYGLSLIGTTATLYEGGLEGTLVRSVQFVRGAIREPTANTMIMTRAAGTATSYVQYAGGLQYDIKINGTLWPMSERNQSIQLPSPSGLGVEVLVNPELAGLAGNLLPSWNRFNSATFSYVGKSLKIQNSAAQAGAIRQTFPTIAGAAYVIEFIVREAVGTQLRFTIAAGPIGTYSIGIAGGNFPASSDTRRIIFTATSDVSTLDIYCNSLVEGDYVAIEALSIKPLWIAKATSVIANGDFSSGSTGWAVYNGAAINVVSGQAVLSTVAGQPSRMERGTLALTPGKYYVASVNIVARDVVTRASLSIIRGAAGNYQSVASVQTTALGRVSLVFLAPSSDALVQIYGDSTNAGSVTVDEISLRELDSICNPLTLVNTNPDRWEDASYLRAFSFNDPRNTQYLPLI